MKKVLIVILLQSVFIVNAIGQCSGTQLTVLNPSFEGTANPHVTPPSWDICMPGVTPDTQPGSWGITLPSSNGSTYIGLVHQVSASWQEGASQTLSSPMIAGTTYNFTLDLATTTSTLGGIIPGCVELQIFGNMGGNSGCDQTELLWSSGDIYDPAHQDLWVTTPITFTPSANYGHLLFVVHGLGCTDLPYIMIDNLSPIIPIVDVPQFTWTNVCQGNTMNFNDASTSTSGTINGWTWNFGDSSPTSNLQNPSHTYATAGSYNVTLTVTSTVPCTTTVTNAVTVYANPTVTVNSPTICSGTTATLTAAGALTYNWTTFGAGNPQTTPILNANASYTVTGTDANGCVNSAISNVTVTAAPVVTASNNGPLCTGQTLNLTSTPAGATSYNWAGPNSFGSALQNPSIIAVTPAATGIYSVTATIGGCTNTATTNVTVNAILAVTASSNSPVCLGQPLNLTVIPPAATSYTWAGPNSFGSAIQSPTIAVATIAATGIYSVTVNASGCSNTTTVSVTINPVPVVSASSNSPICAGQTLNLNSLPAGATSYNWSGPNLFSSATQNPSIAATTIAATGIYTVTATALGCSASNTVNVTVNSNPTSAATSTDEHCGHADGVANANVIGGVGPYTYNWNGSIQPNPLTGLTANTYAVTVTDVNGCSATSSTVISNIAGPSAPWGTIVQETCGNCNGSITVAPINGTLPYTSSWSNMQNGLTINNLCAGSITVTITDANNCTATNTTIITNTPGPTVQASMVSPENCGQSDGQGIANVLGGTNPIGYLWSNTQVTPNLTNVIGGNYTVVVTDANSCTATSSVVISVIGGPTATLQSVDALCDKPTGEVTVTALGGIGVYSYQWTSGQNTSTISNLTAGNYCVTVTSGGCSTSECVTIVNIPGPIAEFTANPTLMTIEQANCTITDQSVGATSWNWNFGDGSSGSIQNPNHSYETTGDYLISLTVTDINGCVDSIAHPIKVKGVYLIYIPNTFTPNGDGVNDFFFPTGLNIDMNNFEMFIYDRWGKHLYYTKDISKPWNGTLDNVGKIDQIVMGVYVYKILTKDIVDGAKHEYVGRVTIIQ